jgi:hypothetical protein
MEAVGRAPLLVAGDLENFKLTQPGDFALAERLLATRSRGSSEAGRRGGGGGTASAAPVGEAAGDPVARRAAA